MTSEEFQYGIFTQNDIIRDISKNQNPRTVLAGQICIIDAVLGNRTLRVRLLEENNSWEAKPFVTVTENCIIPVPNSLLHYISAIYSPLERVKLTKNKTLCEKLQKVTKDAIVGFTEASEVKLGRVRYIGFTKGIGYCYGLELHEKQPGNKCDGVCAGIRYFTCRAGQAVFTTIERIIPTSYTDTIEKPAPQPQQNDLEISLQRNISSFANGTLDKLPREDIVTKYGEYSKKISMPSTNLSHNMKNSLSLQNILDMNSSVNTNNDFDQNTIIQPDQSHLMNNEKLKNKSEINLHDLIGNPWPSSEVTKPENFSNLRKNLDKNDNIKEYKYNNFENRNSLASSNGTLNRTGRNKSSNILSHLIDGNGTIKRSTFYTVKAGESNNEKESSREILKKVENGRKPEYHPKELHTKPTATFYVNENPKYTDPLPGSTNDLVVGSVVEVDTDVTEEPLYGVIQWMGFDTEAKFTLVGIELEEEATHLPLTLTDGTHNNERLFSCANGKAFFVPLERCHKDSRFQDGTPTPVHQAAATEVCDCPGIPGAVAPLCMPTEEDVEAVCGKYRGIQGHHNSCYLDVTLFAMFTYTAVFDSLLFRPKNANDIADYEEVQRVLREEIVNPLRKNLFVSADNVMKLRKLLDRLSSVSGLTSEEKDPEEFLNSLLAQILKAEPFLKLNSGQETFHYQLFVEKNAELTLPTVQQLFEQSFLTSDIKLKEVPSCLIVQMPRFGKNYKMYPRILPSQLLDVTDVIEGSPRLCIVCGKLARWECRECFSEYTNQAGLESTAFCENCLKTAHKHERRQRHKPRELAVNPDFLTMEEHCRPPRLFMELFAVICIETSHYVTFVKCGVGHEAPWCFFDSMADRKGEKNGYNIPEMVACPDISHWLSEEKACRQLHDEFPLDRHLPEHAKRLLCDAYICMYQSSDVMMYR